mmetsp:Transcript_29284/g.97343  ORF Transcript_29284/g.97343 Transcript_29284/m.97343 type:complete len:291 (+) Transcript_29284:2661-3533(+)
MQRARHAKDAHHAQHSHIRGVEAIGAEEPPHVVEDHGGDDDCVEVVPLPILPAPEVPSLLDDADQQIYHENDHENHADEVAVRAAALSCGCKMHLRAHEDHIEDNEHTHTQLVPGVLGQMKLSRLVLDPQGVLPILVDNIPVQGTHRRVCRRLLVIPRRHTEDDFLRRRGQRPQGEGRHRRLIIQAAYHVSGLLKEDFSKAPMPLHAGRLRRRALAHAGRRCAGELRTNCWRRRRCRRADAAVGVPSLLVGMHVSAQQRAEACALTLMLLLQTREGLRKGRRCLLAGAGA